MGKWFPSYCLFASITDPKSRRTSHHSLPPLCPKLRMFHLRSLSSILAYIMHPQSQLLKIVFEVAPQIKDHPALLLTQMIPVPLTFLCQVAYRYFHRLNPVGILRTLSASAALGRPRPRLLPPLIVLNSLRNLPRILLVSPARNPCTFTCDTTQLRKPKRASQRPRQLTAIMGKSQFSSSSHGRIHRSHQRRCPRH